MNQKDEIETVKQKVENQTKKEIGVSRDEWRAEKTNREEIQFQTSQFNQHYSSPGSNNCRNALKAHQNITKIILCTPKIRSDST